MNQEIEELIAALAARYEALGQEAQPEWLRQAFVAHIKTLGQWGRELPERWPDEQVIWPERMEIAYAMCSPECGRHQFIVEGGTQECQRCGGLLFRTESRTYARSSGA